MNPRNKTHPKVIQLYVTEEQYERLREHAHTEKKKMAVVIRELIDGLPAYKTTRRVVVRRGK